ncbi:MAG: response regulator transcription factor [Muribaculaceae bacterium]|nr:response regulator transcription factor [Muribaculaceae bacterium]
MTQKIRILLVDDDTKNSLLLERFIEAAGYDVSYAPGGLTGLRMYREISPDLILLDINMPGMNGFEVAREIRSKDKRVIIFFLTDRTEKADRLYGFSLKGNDYIPKPFYPEELIAKINERFESGMLDINKEYRLGSTLFQPNLSTITYGGESHALTVRQSEILTLLAENAGSTVNRSFILQQIWGDESYSNSLALNVQITYLRRLLTDPSLTIVNIKKKGYILRINNSGVLR